MTRTRNEYPKKEHDVYEKTNKKKFSRTYNECWENMVNLQEKWVKIRELRV